MTLVGRSTTESLANQVDVLEKGQRYWPCALKLHKWTRWRITRVAENRMFDWSTQQRRCVECGYTQEAMVSTK